MSDLKPCPSCGHRAALREDRHDFGIVWSIECVDCGLMIEGSDKQKVIDAWQRRRTDGMIRWLDAEIEKCDESRLSVMNVRRNALRECKQQLLKLLDGMGVRTWNARNNPLRAEH